MRRGQHKPLSDYERRVWDLRNGPEKLSYREIAERIGGTAAEARQTRNRIANRLVQRTFKQRNRREGKDRATPEKPRPSVTDRPEAVAGAMVDLSMPEPFRARINRIAQAHGLSPSTAAALSVALHRELAPVGQELEQVQVEKLSDVFTEKLGMLLGGISQEKIDNAPLNHIAIAAGIFTDKKMLLEGRPTEIIDDRRREKLETLLPAFIKEAQRRGLLAHVDPVTGEGKVVEAEYREVES